MSRLRLHLVCMPWFPVGYASIQLAALKAYVDARFDRAQVQTYTYVPHLTVPLSCWGGRYADVWERFHSRGDLVYLVLALRRFTPERLAQQGLSSAELLERINAAHPRHEPIPLGLLDEVQQTTEAYLEERLVPALDPDAVNVLGFTVSQYQLYASLFAARLLGQGHGRFPHRLIFGGGALTDLRYAALLGGWGLQGHVLLGEGELRLGAYLRGALQPPGGAPEEAVDGLHTLEELAALAARRHVGAPSPRWQVPALADLPAPDFGDFFQELRAISETSAAFEALKRRTFVPLEGSRGCAHACDFCNQGRTWVGHRALSAPALLDRVTALERSHGPLRFKFVDTTCDAWVGEYARGAIRAGRRIWANVDLRAAHGQDFWTALALSGVSGVQLGIESLSSDLLRRMNKGTRVIDNLRALKYLRELGVPTKINLIVQHPRSTVEHVAQTQQVLRDIPHLERVVLAYFQLEAGSPLFGELTAAGARLQRGSPALPGDLAALQPTYSYLLPPGGQLDDATREAWRAFVGWVKQRQADDPSSRSLRQHLIDEQTLLLEDARFGEPQRVSLGGAVARIYRACHAGPTPEQVCARLHLPPDTLWEAVRPLLERRLLLSLDGRLLSLALRPRDQLVCEYFKRQGARAARGQGTPARPAGQD